MKKITLGDHLRYRFDNYMSKGTIALIGGLGALSLAVILIAALVIVLFRIAPDGAEPGSLSLQEASWAALMRTLDAGTMGGDTGLGYRLVMFLVTLGGVFVVSSLIGVLTTGVEGKMEELQKGRSRVVENNHTVILGWSPQVFAIISELVLANENQKNPCIVVLGDHDKVEMEDEIRENVGSTGKTRVVCRTGSPLYQSDLEIASIATARAIIVIAPEDENADTHTIKTVLAITNGAARRAEPYHIVAKINDPKNMDAARLVGRDEVQFILASDITSRITAQACRQSGLSVVYTELLDFGGDEIYFKEESALVGKPFSDALVAYEDSAVIGLHPKSGAVALNPPMDTVLRAGDQLIVISADDDTIRLSGAAGFSLQKESIRTVSPAVAQAERTLLLGWNPHAPIIIRELDNYVGEHSEVMVVAEDIDLETVVSLCGDLQNTTLTAQPADTTSRAVLDGLKVGTFDHIIVLSSHDLEVQNADARTLVTLLQLRDMAEKSGSTYYIVSEMLDVRNRELAEVTRADDFIVSDRLISLMMTQIAENKNLTAVFQDLFDPEGSEVYIKPANNYIASGQPVNFYTIIESAKRKGEVAFGYRIQAESGDAAASYGIHINPKKSEMITFTDQDRIIVLAED